MGFAVSMLFDFDFGGYCSSMFIALSFVGMICAYTCLADPKCRAAGYASMAFAAGYATIILLVYFTQITTVRLRDLTPQVAEVLDYQQMGLMFNYDMLGYALMALSTFFAGLTVRVRGKGDKWLKYLLLIHGVFFVSCLLVPMLGVFKPGGPKWGGVAVLEFWCPYFCPSGILSRSYFRRWEE